MNNSFLVIDLRAAISVVVIDLSGSRISNNAQGSPQHGELMRESSCCGCCISTTTSNNTNSYSLNAYYICPSLDSGKQL